MSRRLNPKDAWTYTNLPIGQGRKEDGEEKKREEREVERKKEEVGRERTWPIARGAFC